MIEAYSLLWKNLSQRETLPSCHYKAMQEIVSEKIVSGKIGLEVGCGCGVDLKMMAEENPNTNMIGIDISDVSPAEKLCQDLKNIRIVKASALNIPFPDNTFDFCYSFGVIHHTSSPLQCFREIHRVLKKGGRAFFYLYEDHEDNIKKYAIKIITLMRKFTLRLDKRVLYFLSMLASPIIYILFTLPSKILPQRISEKIPFNFGTSPLSLVGDIYDRFAAPIEIRFNKKELDRLLKKSGFCNIQFTKLKTSAGHVIWMKKK